jgi:hypothetical protein
MITVEVPEEDRQLTLLALAVLSLERPGWEYACRQASKRFSGEALYDDFRAANRVAPGLKELQ